MMNVKYILSAYDLPSDRLKAVWSGETTSMKIPIRLYENPFALPRVYLANHVVPLPENETETLKEVLKPGRDFIRETLLECGSCAVSDALQSSADRADVTSYAVGDVTVRTSTSGTRVLVFGENNLRGWQVTIDGKRTTAFFANYLYQGVIVPAGAHDVRFFYGRP
jgi:hypothetical protein